MSFLFVLYIFMLFYNMLFLFVLYIAHSTFNSLGAFEQAHAS